MQFGSHTHTRSLSHTHQIKKNQQRIEMTLEGKKIPYKKLDIAADESLKTKMREIAGNPKALPPQLANGDQYCGVSFMAVVLIHLQALSPSCSILHSEKWELEGLV